MAKYNASIANDADLNESGPSSFGTGRYACTIEAENIKAAVKKLVERAKKEAWFGEDWKALVDQIGTHGQRNRDLFAENATVELRDGGEIKYWHLGEIATV